MPNTTHIVTPIRGMVTDLHLLNTSEESYSFALNAVKEDYFPGNSNFIQNESSNINSVVFPPGYQVVGFKEIPEQLRTIYMLTNGTTNQIGEVLNCNYKSATDLIEKVYCKNCSEYTSIEKTPLEQQTANPYCQYTILISDICPTVNLCPEGVNPIPYNNGCLNFNINYPVDIEYKITDCSLNIYFTDNLNERRFLYFDYTDNDVSKPLVVQDKFKFEVCIQGDNCKTPIYCDAIDCEKIKFNPNYSQPCIEFIGFVDGGNLKAGSYQVLIAYADEFGNPTSNYFAASEIMPLFINPIVFETNYITGRALSFNIINLINDSIFQYYNIVIAQTIDQFTTFNLIGTFNTSVTSYTYTGFENNIKSLSPTEVFFRRPYYEFAKGVTTANDFLFFTGLTEYPLLNLQPVANAVLLNWITVGLKEGDYYYPENTFYFRTYQRDEVYSFGIIFEFNNGRETCAFHIPGREAISSDLIPISSGNADFIPDIICNSDNPVTTKPKWQVYNTGSIIGGNHQYNDNCQTNYCWEYGNMSYWESTETYPNISQVWGEELCGKPIRHHKFPDCAITHIHDRLNISLPTNSTDSAAMYAANNYIFPIGVTVDHNSVKAAIANAVTSGVVTQDEANTIVSYRIVRGNRVGNKSIAAKGLIYNMFQYQGVGNFNTNTYYFPNYPYNDLRQDAYHNGVSLSDFTRYTFHSPDTSFENTAIGSILKVETEEYGQSNGYFTHSECQAEQKFLTIFAQAIAFGLGLAAAISATGEKQCKQITYYGDLNTQVNDFPVVKVKGGAEINKIISGTLAEGSGTTSNGSIDTHIDSTVEKEKYNETGSQDNLKGVNAQSTVTGQNVSPSQGNKVTIGGFGDILTTTDSTGSSQNVNNPSQVMYTTCKGSPSQIFNNGGPITDPLNPPSAGQLVLNSILGILSIGGQVLQRVMLGIIEMNKIIDTFTELIPYVNYSMQYNSIGKYNNYTIPTEGNLVRQIIKGAYLDPFLQDVDEPAISPTSPILFNTVHINNWDRESSVYLKLNSNLKNPSNQDNSKCAMRDVFGSSGSVNKLNQTFNRNISSYYVSIKDNVPNQWGQLCNIQYLETNSPNNCSFYLNQDYNICESKIFGGDTFINRFALKRKMPFFLHTMCNVANGNDILYGDLANIGTGSDLTVSGSTGPKYYFNTPQPLLERLAGDGNGLGSLVTSIAEIPINIFKSMTNNSQLSLINDNSHNFDVSDISLFYQSGLVCLFNYGIPYFLVESDVNVDYRYGQNHKDKDFYPHNSDLKTWLEEGNVPLVTDNYYFYNKTYSKQDKESPICNTCITDPQQLDLCNTVHTNRIIYSDTSTTETPLTDNWLIFKANNFYNFPLTLGKLVSADGIENDKVLVRLENGSQIFSAYNVLQVTEENIQVGTGGIFQSRPRDLAITDLGYAGSQHIDILHTEFGHIWADALRGQVFNLGVGGGGVDEISKDGMKNWFRENLPFQIKKDFPSIVNIDNNLSGIGLHYCFDKRFSRFLITKLDYKVVDKNVQYNIATQTFYIIVDSINTPVRLNDTRYFCNKSWTISYNVVEKSWTSFHSYLPNLYVEHIDTFDSGTFKPFMLNRELNKIQKLYTHNFGNKSYQVFYDNLEPFIIEFQAKQSLNNNTLNSIEYYLDVIRYHNDFDTFYNRTKTFNKAIIYNERQTSGLLHMKVSNPEDLTEIYKYPNRVHNGYEILTSNSENIWRFNDFWDVGSSQLNNLPLLNLHCNNVDKTLNNIALNYDKPDFDRQLLRQRMCKIRLINDIESNYHYIFAFAQINQKQSFR